eukprot:Awhi_evm1s8760
MPNDILIQYTNSPHGDNVDLEWAQEIVTELSFHTKALYVTKMSRFTFTNGLRSYMKHCGDWMMCIGLHCSCLCICFGVSCCQEKERANHTFYIFTDVGVIACRKLNKAPLPLSADNQLFQLYPKQEIHVYNRPQ